MKDGTGEAIYCFFRSVLESKVKHEELDRGLALYYPNTERKMGLIISNLIDLDLGIFQINS